MTTDTEIELTPCPFCGSEAKFFKCVDPEDFRVMCTKGGKCTASRDQDDLYGYATAEIAAEAWNTRQHETNSDPSFLMGAIENGRAFIARLENNYRFEDDGRSLASNAEWDELKRCFEYMAEYLLSETGLSPRELAEQRKELLGVLAPFAMLADEADKFGHEDNSTCQWRIRASDLRKARAAIRKAKGEPVLAA